jgi:trypsin
LFLILAGAFPWQISLLLDHSHKCGGTIIDDTTVVTAAHCMRNVDPAAYRVVAGEQTVKLKHDCTDR